MWQFIPQTPYTPMPMGATSPMMQQADPLTVWREIYRESRKEIKRLTKEKEKSKEKVEEKKKERVFNRWELTTILTLCSGPIFLAEFGLFKIAETVIPHIIK